MIKFSVINYSLAAGTVVEWLAYPPHGSEVWLGAFSLEFASLLAWGFLSVRRLPPTYQKKRISG